MSTTLPESRCADKTDGASILHELAAPFAVKEVQFKPQTVKGNRALAIAYIDARTVMDRLDRVVGVENWQDHYQLLPDNSVMCRLRLRIGVRWITKADVGSPPDQPDGGDRLKAAFSDALKRAAVKFGIGRYLYNLPTQWCDYDPVRRQFANTPKLPQWAMPQNPPHPSRSGALKSLPADGVELYRRLREADADLADKQLCQIGALLAHVTQAGIKEGFAPDMSVWTGPAIELAVAETKTFKTRLAKPAAT